MNRFVFVAGLVLVVILASFSLAEIPRLINYQGMLTDHEGNPLNAPQDLTFRIYNVESGGTLLWGETQNNVPVDNGLFNVVLGTITPVDLPFDEDYWLEIEVGVLGALSPRVKLTSVGYAYRAGMADTASYAIEATSAETDSDWTISGSSIYSAVSGNVGIGTTTPDVKLHVKGEGYYPFVKTEVTDETGAGVQFRATGVLTEPGGTNQWGLFIRASDNSGDLYINEDYVGGAWSPTTRLVIENETGNVGIGTTDPAAPLTIYPIIGTEILLTGGGSNADIKSTNQFTVGTSTTSPFSLATSNVNRLWITGDGDIGIGTTSPDEKLHVNGNLKVTGKINGAIGLVAAGTYHSYLREGFNITSISYNSGENRYEVTLTGINYDYRDYVTVVTPTGTTAYFVSTGSVSNMLLIYFNDKNGDPAQAISFHFVVYDIE